MIAKYAWLFCLLAVSLASGETLYAQNVCADVFDVHSTLTPEDFFNRATSKLNEVSVTGETAQKFAVVKAIAAKSSDVILSLAQITSLRSQIADVIKSTGRSRTGAQLVNLPFGRSREAIELEFQLSEIDKSYTRDFSKAPRLSRASILNVIGEFGANENPTLDVLLARFDVPRLTPSEKAEVVIAAIETFGNRLAKNDKERARAYVTDLLIALERRWETKPLWEDIARIKLAILSSDVVESAAMASLFEHYEYTQQVFWQTTIRELGRRSPRDRDIARRIIDESQLAYRHFDPAQFAPRPSVWARQAQSIRTVINAIGRAGGRQ